MRCDNIRGRIGRVRHAAIWPAMLILAGCANGGGNATGGNPPPSTGITLTLVQFVGGFTNPVGVYSAGGTDDRLFIVEQSGLIRIVRSNGAVDAVPFLDITDRVHFDGGEAGLLGLAFHPDYPTTGYIYVNYTALVGGQLTTRISRFSVAADPDVADPGSEEILLTVDQPLPTTTRAICTSARTACSTFPWVTADRAAIPATARRPSQCCSAKS
jgi:hypothetical protein